MAANVVTSSAQWRFHHKAGLYLLGFAVLLFISSVKAESILNFAVDPWLLAYTFFVTCFEISRLIAASLYRYSQEAVMRPNPESIEYLPSVSFVIPCMNEENTIADTITKCFEADYPQDLLEVIVINDGSTDNTGKVLDESKNRFPKLKVIHWKKNRGKRHGMAEGFKMANGEIIIQLDSDSWIEPNSVRDLIQPFQNPVIGAVCAHADPANADKNLLTKMQAAYYFMSFRILKAAESTFLSVFCCSGCSSAYRKSVVLPILDAWLEERFLGLPVTWGDDRALTNWVIKRGYKTIYANNAKAYTYCPESWKIFFKQQVRWKKGWFVNSLFASKFIVRKNPFVAFTYFFPLIFVTLITPFVATRALIYNPLFRNVSPFYYIMGALLVALLITIFYRYVERNNKYWPYVFVWGCVNMVVLSFILFYALLTIQNRRWGTR